jgi:hypothetical protein
MFKLNDLCYENQIKTYINIYNGKIIHFFLLSSSYKKMQCEKYNVWNK